MCSFTRNLIANKRFVLEDALKSFDGIRFYISCITGTKTHRNDANEIRCGIAYFMVIQPTESTTEENLFAAFHDHNLEVSLTKIKSKRNEDDGRERVLDQLCQVVKV